MYRERLVPYIKEERRAPTDDSVRLLNEMQEKVKENIIESVRVDSTVLKNVFAWISNKNTIDKDQINWNVKFNLNGKDYNLSGYEHTSSLIPRSMADKISSTISLEILKEIIASFPIIFK